MLDSAINPKTKIVQQLTVGYEQNLTQYDNDQHISWTNVSQSLSQHSVINSFARSAKMCSISSKYC